MRIGSKDFDMNGSHCYVMGILNVTPDSFSDGGSFVDTEKALRHAEQMIKEGADIIDVGGESTRPGHVQISESEEIERVSEVISLIKSHFDASISIDTYKAAVADAALDAGADLVNDIWGLRFERFNGDLSGESSTVSPVSKLAQVTAQHMVPIILMYNDNLGRSLDDRNEETVRRFLEANQNRSAVELLRSVKEENVTDRIIWGLKESIRIAEKAGISKESIIVDPGIGFAKTQYENLLTVKNLKAIVSRTGYPMLFAASRKSMIGNALDLPVTEREEGTLVTTVMAVEAGCKFVRVHDVEKNVRAIKMAESILYA